MTGVLQNWNGGLFPIKVWQVCVIILEWWTLPYQGRSGVSVCVWQYWNDVIILEWWTHPYQGMTGVCENTGLVDSSLSRYDRCMWQYWNGGLFSIKVGQLCVCVWQYWWTLPYQGRSGVCACDNTGMVDSSSARYVRCECDFSLARYVEYISSRQLFRKMCN